MRTFLLVLTAAMAATSVSCLSSVPVPAPPAVSDACYNTSVALSIPQISLAESYIIKSGCQNLDYDITDTRTQCGKILNTNWRCECDTTFTNTSSWESSVRNISSGQPCYLSYTVELKGNTTSTNQPRTLFASRTNYDSIALGGACNTTEIERGLESDVTTILGSLEYSFVNANSNVTDITWTFATVTVTATCNSMFAGEKKSTKDLIPGSNTGGTTTTPPTTPTPTPSGSSSNSNSTSSPTTVPPVTPNPTSNSSSSSSSSSTGGKGTGTSTGNGNGAPVVMMHSATAIVVAVICVFVAIIEAA